MNSGLPEDLPATAGRLHIERWHGVANAAVVALFGMPLINPTGAARAAWFEVSQLVVGFSLTSTRARKPSPKI